MKSFKSVVLILAAGEARRMGRAKQLLEFKGKSLLQRAIENALKVGSRVFVVLGAHKEKTLPIALGYPIETVINERFQEGISTSIRIGVDAVMGDISDLDGILITLADQPRISADHLTDVLRLAKNNSNIVATEYQGTLGVPAYFPHEFLKDLISLQGDSGAKVILKAQQQEVISVPYEGAAFDIDTNQDWEDFLEGGIGT